MSALPDFLLEKATRRGIPAEEARRLWTGHTAWCDAHGKDYGGLLWDTLLGKYIDRIKSESKLGDDDAERAKRDALEREAKALEDAEYAKTAISLPEWLADLRVKPDFAEELTPIEAHIVRYREPQPGEDSAAWLMAALADYRGPIAECHKRRRRV